MARVNVDSYAFDDPRFGLLAAAVRHLKDRDHALGKCLRVWHLCASRQIDRMRGVELAACLGYRKPVEAESEAIEAFCELAGLGEHLVDGTIRIRGTEGRTDYVQKQSESVEARILEHLYAGGPQRKNEVKLALGFAKKARSTFYAVVDRAVKSGAIVVLPDGRIAAPGEGVQDASIDRPLDVHGQTRDGPRTGSLVPDPDLDPARVSGARASMDCPLDDGMDGVQDAGELDTAPSMPANSSAAAPVREHHSAREGAELLRDAAWRVAQRHDQLGLEVAREAGRDWRARSTAGPGEWRPVLREATEDEVLHALEMLAVQARERIQLGVPDPLRFLRDAASPGVFQKAARLANAAEAQEAARASPGRRPTKPPEPVRKLKRVG